MRQPTRNIHFNQRGSNPNPDLEMVSQARKTKVIQIEVDSENSSRADQGDGWMSPAHRNNQGFKKAGVKMSAVGNEVNFPRKDNAYMGKQCLNYQEYESRVWQERVKGHYEVQLEWFAYGLMGVVIAMVAFVMDMIEESLVHFKDHFTQHQIDNQNLVGSWLFYALFSAFLGVVSCTLTTFWGPGASGSGVAEIIGYLNGVNYPDTIDIKTLITKTFGVVLAVAGTLCVGKEGPLAHIGANVGALVPYLPKFDQYFKFLHNDHKKRQLIAAGASAGVSVAFGAPIGGALFIFELSNQPFWKFSILWKTFLSCSMAVFCLAIFEALANGHFSTWTASSLKFGKVRVEDVTPTDVLVGAVIMGLISGLLGSFFISINTKVNAIRAKIWTMKWQKPVDTFIFCFLTATCFYWFPYAYSSCVSRQVLEGELSKELQLSLDEVLDSEEEQSVYQAWCKDDNTYDPLASIFWQTEGGLIRDILSESVMCSTTQMVVFGCVWYFWTIVTYGTNVPSGLFLPGMIIGCAMGEIYAKSMWDIGVYDEDHYKKYRVIYIILGMGSMLAGYTRMTYSLAVIVMETSQALNIFIPAIVTIGVANITGAFFTRGLYDRAVRAKQMPILKKEVPMKNREIRAENIMAVNPIYLRSVDTVKRIHDAIKSPHHGFPIVNMSGQVIGLISKNYLIVLILKRSAYKNENQKYFVLDGKIKRAIKEQLLGGDRGYEIDSKSENQDQSVNMSYNGSKSVNSYNKQGTDRRFSNRQNTKIEDVTPGRDKATAYSSESEDSYYGDTPNPKFNFRRYMDYDAFPESTGPSIEPWTDFTRDFKSVDLKNTADVEHICQTHRDTLVDLRPYMIANPETCTRFDFLPKIHGRFRQMHLRHMIVVNPTNNRLQGIITRQDIFTWMPL